ncbi:hypothetical protein N7495_008674 [Penicillium taxi]|uniref:uncharacterized protein n=1 Tax=Penicillium taxi TaxID=168475 RepID=UPI00254536D3|nr:uncharacterized protein N7495_008674 [Penicillium taxi]KAJ5888633.1 hypothetical protein N7495_008674 [Penicillium taxi]
MCENCYAENGAQERVQQWRQNIESHHPDCSGDYEHSSRSTPRQQARRSRRPSRRDSNNDRGHTGRGHHARTQPGPSNQCKCGHDHGHDRHHDSHRDHHHHHDHDHDHRNNHDCEVHGHQSVSNNLFERQVTRDMLFDGDGLCVICSDVAELDSYVTGLWCGHWFHTECILPWVERNKTCPICRSHID